MQQLGLADKGTLEDRQRPPRFRTVSQEAQTESGNELQPCDSKQPGEDRSPGRTGEPRAGHGPRTAAECPASGDARLGTEPGGALPMDSMNLEGSSSELEGLGAEESGEHFFDAREAHSDENPGESESELLDRKEEEEEVQIRISGEPGGEGLARCIPHLTFCLSGMGQAAPSSQRVILALCKHRPDEFFM